METKIILLHWQVLLIIFIMNNNSTTMGQLSGESCTKIVDGSTRVEVSLYENTTIKRSDFQKIRDVDEISMRKFVIPEKNNCFFVLCSYQKYYDLLDADFYLRLFPDDSIFCQLYSSGNGSSYSVLSAVKVSSVACRCPGENYASSPDCYDATTNATCFEIMNKYDWSPSQCAMLFRERNCNGCVFPRVDLNREKEFHTLNSYNFKSIIARPGCYVEERFRNGSSIVTSTYTEVGSHIKFKFTQESLNYSCYCEGEDVLDAAVEKDLINETKSGSFSMLHGTGVLFLIVGTMLIATIVMLKRRQDKLTKRQVRKYVKFVRLTKEQDYELFLQSLSTETNGVDDKSKVVSLLEHQFNSVCQPNFRKARESFTIGDKIGEGQFGKVYKGMLGPSMEVAVKRVENGGDKVVESFLREVKCFNGFGEGHENIVQFFGACYNGGEICIITKYMELGSLQNYLRTVVKPKITFDISSLKCSTRKNFGNGYFIENLAEQDNNERIDKSKYSALDLYSQFLLWANHIANGMDFLHSNNILHVDLAVRNILLDVDKVAKICDFGLSRMCFGEKDYAKSLLSGHFPFNSFAPEVNTENVENEAKKMSIYVDRWAYGCTVWETFSLGASPYQGKSLLGVALQLKENHILPQPDLAPDNVYEKLTECWNKVPHERPDFRDLKNFFNGLLILRYSNTSESKQ